MKALFLSGHYEELKQLNQFLNQQELKTDVGVYNGYMLLKVEDKEYINALSVGSLYCISHKLLNVNWLYENNIMFNLDDIAVESIKAIVNKRELSEETIRDKARKRYSSIVESENVSLNLK